MSHVACHVLCSSSILDRSCLTDDRNLDLPRELDGALHLPLDLPREGDGLQVGDALRLDDDPHLAAGLDGVGLLDPGEGVADGLQRLQPLDVVLQRVAARPGPRAADGVCDDCQPRVERRVETRRGLEIFNQPRVRLVERKRRRGGGQRQADGSYNDESGDDNYENSHLFFCPL